MSDSPQSYLSFIADADARYCARLRPGDPLQLVSHENCIELFHAKRRVGTIPKSHSWVAEALASGNLLVCSIEFVNVKGLVFKRATRVELRIDITEGVGTIGRAVQWSASSVTRAAGAVSEIGGRALRVAADTPVAVGRAAEWTTNNVLTPPVRVVYRGVDGAANLIVRRPYRFMRRLVLWGIGLAFAALALIVLILILLHTLPRRQ
jgi:hypothetical protein